MRGPLPPGEIPQFILPRGTGEAAQIQRQLRDKVVLQGNPAGLRFLAALDASHPTRFSRQQGASVAAAVLWDREAAKVVEVATAAVDATGLFPYVPGFLSFREIPAYLEALARLSSPPQLLLVDGQGVAHPRGLGIASHLGVHLDLPSIGVAKRLLYGHPEGELAEEAGRAVRLMAKGAQIGWVYRSRAGVRPLYISPGHRVGMLESLELIRSLVGRTRLPEPLRQAHLEAGQLRRRLNEAV
ncbi:endonuclease V [Meiothermus granaticius]|uniref:Endonuclease V n=1 Tax=Meiothermus granaticius NBRC 107808 TaxID=1227551 RepID=A0A399FE81_9DEIN|nr:endonuclease V [Meiothermus granaticius]RIH93372.1 Endonuclease V [Meiothermus granaticius NBRC 107808]